MLVHDDQPGDLLLRDTIHRDLLGERAIKLTELLSRQWVHQLRGEWDAVWLLGLMSQGILAAGHRKMRWCQGGTGPPPGGAHLVTDTDVVLCQECYGDVSSSTTEHAFLVCGWTRSEPCQWCDSEPRCYLPTPTGEEVTP